jgi:hypothetical protein
LSGKLHDDDYEMFMPVIEAAIKEHGTMRVIAKLEDFHGWDLPGLWEDVKFTTGHYSDIERIAIVGDQKWEAWMAQVCKPFTHARVRYFDKVDEGAAWGWVQEGPALQQAA